MTGPPKKLEQYHFNSVFELFNGPASYTQGFRSIHNPTLPSSKKEPVMQLFSHYSFALWSPVEKNGPTNGDIPSGFFSHILHTDVEWRLEQPRESSSLFVFFVLIYVLSFSGNLRMSNNQKGRILAK